jgi:outer membrane protein TolC
MGIFGTTVRTAALCAVCLIAQQAAGQGFPIFIQPEQRRIVVRDPASLPPVRLPAMPPPITVRDPQEPPRRQVMLALDDALRMALGNTEVVRVLAGVTSNTSGQTIYDAAIVNTAIDEQNARFDPVIEGDHVFSQTETPSASFIGPPPFDPDGVFIDGTQVERYDHDFRLSETNTLGGTSTLRVFGDVSQFSPGFFPLNPEGRSSVEMSYVQPLLQGGGRQANLAPVIIARIDVERSYFQYKDGVQELVRGVVDAYWSLVFARIDVWVRQQQVEQGQFAYDLGRARVRFGLADSADEAQARVALANFRAALVTSRANLLASEAALRSMMGVPPVGPEETVPVTPPFKERIWLDWDRTIRLATERRPDLVELKLVIEADQQQLILVQNQARPRVDATALYRWNGLEGVTPGGTTIASGPGDFTDWTLGVNFSVPLGLREGRAGERRQELVLARDRANLQEGVHTAVHQVAANFRNLDQFFAEYEAFRETREASRENLEQQLGEFRSGRTIFLNVLQAITDWGNAASSEAQALARYNTELANLERQTGTILETHGIRFLEERFAAVGPLGRWADPRFYPRAMPPTPNAGIYPPSRGAPEAELEDDLPDYRRRRTRPPRELLPPPLDPEPPAASPASAPPEQALPESPPPESAPPAELPSPARRLPLSR